MESREILKNIFTSYCTNQETQTSIAKQYNVSQQTISELLQECGFHRHILNSVDASWQNPEVQRICEEIRKANENK